MNTNAELEVRAEETKAIPFVPGPFFVGYFFPFFNHRFDFLTQLGEQHGAISRFKIGPLPLVYLNSPELIYELLVERPYDFEKGAIQRKVFRAVLGNALNATEDEYHRKQRLLLAPVFQQRHLSVFSDVIVDYVEKGQAGWQDGATFELVEALFSINLPIIAKILFGLDNFGPSDPLWQAVTSGTAYLDYQLSRLMPLPLAVPTPFNLHTTRQLAIFNQHLYKMISERRADKQPREDLLSMMLHSRYEDGTPMSDKQLRDETASAFVASYDNTGTALAWTIYLLAQNPEVYARLQAEADQVLGNRVATYEDFPKLTYTTQVLKEGLRLFPTTALAMRQPKFDTTIGGYPVHKGEFLVLSPLVMHRRADFYPDPLRFEPNRFTAENERKLLRCTYLPFGTGPRTCIGNHFTLLENTLMLATLTKHLTFELLPGQTVEPVSKAILRPKNGIKVRVRRR